MVDPFLMVDAFGVVWIFRFEANFGLVGVSLTFVNFYKGANYYISFSSGGLEASGPLEVWMSDLKSPYYLALNGLMTIAPLQTDAWSFYDDPNSSFGMILNPLPSL